MDPSVLEDESGGAEQLVDTSDLDLSQLADVCSHADVVEEDGIVVCQDCDCNLYNTSSSGQGSGNNTMECLTCT